MQVEVNDRVRLINSLLTTPHGDLARLREVHDTIIATDPILYGHLGAWYTENGEVRDHGEVFVAQMFRSELKEHRDAAFVFLQSLEPYRVARVIRYLKGWVSIRLHSLKNSNRLEAKFGGKVSSLGFVDRQFRGKTLQFEKIKEEIGPFRSIPRSARTAGRQYLRQLEANPARFDGAVMQARKHLRYLYSTLRVKPSDRAQEILFEDNPPADSVLSMIKVIAQAEPEEQARLIVEHGLPYKQAVSIAKSGSPMVMAALINSMTPQEVINHLKGLKAKGAMDNPELKALIEAKLEAAKTNKRASAYKAKVAAEVADVSEDVRSKLDQVTETKIKAKGRITRPTGLLVDKSGSLAVAIEAGKRIGAMIAGVAEAPLWAYAFDTIAYPVTPEGKELSDWEMAMKHIRAANGTACGVGVDALRRAGRRVEQIVIVTDEADNTAPLFAKSYQDYVKEIGVTPHVVVVIVGENPAHNYSERVAQERFRQSLESIPHDVFDLRNADYYALPNLIPFLTRPSQAEFLMEIMSTPLPTRSDSPSDTAQESFA